MCEFSTFPSTEDPFGERIRRRFSKLETFEFAKLQIRTELAPLCGQVAAPERGLTVCVCFLRQEKSLSHDASASWCHAPNLAPLLRFKRSFEDPLPKLPIRRQRKNILPFGDEGGPSPEEADVVALHLVGAAARAAPSLAVRHTIANLKSRENSRASRVSRDIYIYIYISRYIYIFPSFGSDAGSWRSSCRSRFPETCRRTSSTCGRETF